MKYKIQLFILCQLLSACSFQPNNADGITLSRVSQDTLSIGIIDSYNVIKKYNMKKINDTLYIDIESIYSPEKLLPPIHIFIDSAINYIKLQNDKIFTVDSIPIMR